MKIKPSFKKVLFIAFLVAVQYLYFIKDVIHSGLWTGLEELFYFAFALVLFVIAIPYCYLIVLLEEKNLLAPHFFFRFAVPYIVICVLFWIVLNYDGDYFPSYQQYTFNEYIDRLSDFIVFAKNVGIMCLTVSIVLSISEREK